MPGRVLDGTSADIRGDTGALSGMTHGTVAIVLQRGAVSATHDYFVAHDSAGTGLWGLYFDSTTNAASWWTGSGSGTGPAVDNTTDKVAIFARKAPGLSAPRWSIYNYTTGAYTHTASGTANDPGTAPGTDGSFRFSWGGGEFFNGKVWVRAAWANRLPWSADAAGDTALEAAGLPWKLAHWLTAQPDALWVPDQQIVEQLVLDRTGKGADESARTGTTVTWDTPPGLDLRLPETIRVKATSGGGTTFTQSVAGAVTPAGSLTKRDQKPIAGSVGPIGGLARQTNKTLAGSVTPSGVLTQTIVRLLSLAGAITPAGALIRQAQKALAGALAPSGALVRQAQKPLTGSATPTGSLTKQTQKTHSGTLTPSGVLATTLVRLLSLAGSLTPTGSLLKQAGKALGGSVTPAGAIAKRVGKVLTGEVSPSGAILKLISRLLGGSVTPSGTVSNTLPGAAVTPVERTYTVEAESRTYTVEAEPRTYTVPAESRILEVT